MGKLLKKLKPYTVSIIIIIILVACTSIATLYLPDRMSNIIGDGIKSEYLMETTDNGESIFIKDDYVILGNKIPVEMPMPKFVYSNAGKLVTELKDGKVVAIIQKDANGNWLPEMVDGKPVSMTIPINGTTITFNIPKFVRTSDGTTDTEEQPGEMLLDDKGTPQIATKQVANLNIIWQNGLIMILITIASSLASIIVAYLSANVALKFSRDVRRDIFHKINDFSLAEEDKFGTSSLITRSTNDVTQVEMLVMMFLRIMITVPIMFIGGLIMANSKDKEMTKVIFYVIPIIAIVIFLVAKTIIPLFKVMQKKIDRLTLVARESITGIRVVRAFGGEKKATEKFDNANKDITSLGLKTSRIMAILMPLMTLIMSGTILSIMFIAIFNIDSQLKVGSIDFKALGNMMAVIQYIMQIMMSIVMLAMIFIMVPRASVSAVRIGEILESKNTVTDKKDALKLYKADIEAELEFENVTFCYPKASKPTLSNVSFICKKGETTAIIGSTGSGKSTIVNLVPRLYDVTEGAIKIGGYDIRDISQLELRKLIGLIPQKATLLSGTILENITYGSEDNSLENAERAAKIACADNFIVNKEGGYLGEVEQNGGNFSGGQKQRLSIARAIARQPKIFVFDDSFSALDFATDKQVRDNLKQVTSDATVLIIAQRIGSIMSADNIIVLDEGKIVASGKHKDLINSSTIYRDIALSQLTEEDLKKEGR